MTNHVPRIGDTLINPLQFDLTNVTEWPPATESTDSFLEATLGSLQMYVDKDKPLEGPIQLALLSRGLVDQRGIQYRGNP